MTTAPIHLTLGPANEILTLTIDRHEMRYGGEELARCVVALHATAFAAVQREREREFNELGVPTWFLTPGSVNPLDSNMPGADLLDGMRAFLDAAAAVTGTGFAHIPPGRVEVSASAYGDLLDLSLPSSLRTVAPSALCSAIVAASVHAAEDASRQLAAARDELRRSLPDG